jgi:cytoskeleton protein RodZ
VKDGIDNPDADPRQVEAFEPLPGDLLLAARKSRGLSQGKVAESLNLDKAQVCALEENRFEDLGAPVFARGHLRKYARLVDLDPAEVMRAYDMIAIEQSGAALNASGGRLSNGDHPAGRPVFLLVAALGLAILAAVTWRLSREGVAPEPTSSADSVSEQRPDPVPAPAATGTAIELPARSEPDAAAEVSAEDAGPVIGSEAVESAERVRQADADSRAASVPDRTATAASQPGAASPGGTAQIAFVFKEDSWIEVYDADGRRLGYQTGRKGTRRSFVGVPPFTVSLGYAPGVDVLLDERPYDVPAVSMRGNTARFTTRTERLDELRPN